MKTTAQIRSGFLEFFRERAHQIVPSSSLVPANDPTLLFTNSGMVQFKNIFLGSEAATHPRVADVQRCLRAGGKHNDLDAVGHTARHHTFFEMLGNWSFGDYFKRDAIVWAWQLLTQEWGIPAERLLVTIYHTDDEAHDIWLNEVGVPAERIIRIGDNLGAPFASDNFWQMADTGPCGPSTEIFYDHGEHIPGGPPGSPDEDGDRFIEIWNLVFMQFDRASDGTLSPLPAPCVDTGMGLERIAAVLQGVHSNYEIDTFVRLIDAAAELTGASDRGHASLRVIADHIRAAMFLVADGVLPSNEGRGYVLRRIIRRALRHGWMLGKRGEFFWQLVPTVIEVMGDAWPQLGEQRKAIENTLQAEERRFGDMLEHGMKVFEQVVEDNPGQIPGAAAFQLYDTYGFPLDLTADIARERGLDVDTAGFEAAMAQQRERARSASQFGASHHLSAELASELPATRFVGYEQMRHEGARVLAIVRDGKAQAQLMDGDEVTLILDTTPFYAESGGQVGDAGVLHAAQGDFHVADTVYLGGVFHAHIGTWQGSSALQVGDVVDAQVDAARREATVLNHSATHLLHGVLRTELGSGVTQKGSLVAPDRLRFDFSHDQPLSPAQLARIELQVNEHIRANHATRIELMDMDTARQRGALALFGEKYGDEVRVLSMGDASVELCGGTHVQRSGDIGLFRILSEGGVAAGVRRIEAVTGAAALAHMAREQQRLAEAAQLLSATPAEVGDKLRQLLSRQRSLEREIESLKARSAAAQLDALVGQAQSIGDIKVLAARLEGADGKSLRTAVDTLKQKLGDCVVLLASVSDDRIALVAGVHGAALEHIKAGDLMADVSTRLDGRGGGRSDMAQGGGSNLSALAPVLASVANWVEQQIR